MFIGLGENTFNTSIQAIVDIEIPEL